MNIIELNKIILGSEKEEIVCPLITKEDIEQFQNLLFVNSQIKSVFEACEDASSFYKGFADFASLIEKEKREDIFYAVKMGTYYQGIPNRLLYILRRLITAVGNRKLPNHIIELGDNLLVPYMKCDYISEAGKFTFKDILDNVCSQSVNLITDSAYSVKISGEVYEVFIPGVERVALLPADIGERLSYEDCLNLQYDFELGVHLNGVPLRTYGNRIGVILNDFDLVEVL